MVSSTNVLLLKTAIVLLVCCFAECAAGSCMNYGHSCWGAHGKRNGAADAMRIRNEESNAVGDTRWYMSRLVQPPVDTELRPWRQAAAELRKKHIGAISRLPLQNDSDVQAENRPNRMEEQREIESESVYDDPESEEVVLMEEPERPIGQKLRLYKLMKKMQKN